MKRKHLPLFLRFPAPSRVSTSRRIPSGSCGFDIFQIYRSYCGNLYFFLLLLVFVFFNNFLMCLRGFHDFLDNFYFWDLPFLVVYGVYLIYMDDDVRILVCREVDYLFFLVCFDVWRRGFMEILRFFFLSIFSFLACDDLGVFGC